MTPQKPVKILETALYVGDLDAAEAFYAEILGLERIQRVGNRHVFFRVGDGVLLLFNAGETEIPAPGARFPVPPHGARGAGHMCFAADAAEIDAWVAQFTALGIEIEADFHWPNGARSIYIRDPHGNSIEFAEPFLWDG
ncbi:VOC family protein [Pseudoruegeria sp. SHC-113]|uniref:VOC family protein n=1 Tax=Pseudoruegeria sp. SHC-113 TaxID=2855439 RepID=UPI0021BAAD61|nr:VOC family protein [Pseudoruegeria sp. SHC-113]MCT8160581.1 VOC family protein [Pseudoruegeria sp. SHC-113]